MGPLLTLIFFVVIIVAIAKAPAELGQVVMAMGWLLCLLLVAGGILATLLGARF